MKEKKCYLVYTFITMFIVCDYFDKAIMFVSKKFKNFKEVETKNIGGLPPRI